MNEQGQQTKVCVKCGKEYPIEKFYTSKKSKDGYASYCKTCNNKSSAESHRRTRASERGFKGGGGNPELAAFSTKTLLMELSARGYHGTLTFTQDVTL